MKLSAVQVDLRSPISLGLKPSSSYSCGEALMDFISGPGPTGEAIWGQNGESWKEKIGKIAWQDT